MGKPVVCAAGVQTQTWGSGAVAGLDGWHIVCRRGGSRENGGGDRPAYTAVLECLADVTDTLQQPMG